MSTQPGGSTEQTSARPLRRSSRRAASSGDLPPLGGQAALHLRREGRGVHLVLEEDGDALRLGVAHVADRADVVAGGEAVVGVPKVDADDEELVRQHRRLPRRDVDLRDALLERLHQVLPAHGALGVQHAHVGPPRALDDAHDDAARPALAAAALGAAAAAAPSLAGSLLPRRTRSAARRVVHPARLHRGVKVRRVWLRARVAPRGQVVGVRSVLVGEAALAGLLPLLPRQQAHHDEVAIHRPIERLPVAQEDGGVAGEGRGEDAALGRVVARDIELPLVQLARRHATCQLRHGQVRRVPGRRALAAAARAAATCLCCAPPPLPPPPPPPSSSSSSGARARTSSSSVASRVRIPAPASPSGRPVASRRFPRH